MTEVLAVDPGSPDPAALAHAAAVLQRGGTVAFPTETVYGLGANALDPAAVRRIFEAKGRPAEDPLIVHVSSGRDLERVARRVPDVALPLAGAFWPGPLTLVLPRDPAVPPDVTAGLDTVAVRVPAHPVALALLETSGLSIAAPSANRFGRASPTNAEHVLDDLEGRIDAVLDGGPTTVGVESTVLDVTSAPPTILRPGGVSREAIERVIGAVEVRPLARAPEGVPASPGLLARHYAVAPELVVVEADTPVGQPAIDAAHAAADLARRYVESGRRVGMLAAEEDLAALAGVEAAVRVLGSARDLEGIARNLFSSMRELEREGVDVIVARTFGTEGLGLALRDRLRRAASQVVVA